MLPKEATWLAGHIHLRGPQNLPAHIQPSSCDNTHHKCKMASILEAVARRSKTHATLLLCV